MSKEAFIENVKKWVVLEKQLKQLNEHTKDIRQRKQNVTTDICSYMSDNSLHEKKIQISDGYLKYAERKEYSPLTYTYIEGCLNQLIQNEEQVKQIIKYLKDNREVRTCVDIRKNETKQHDNL
jgi:protein involved in ribonucleotide reduction